MSDSAGDVVPGLTASGDAVTCALSIGAFSAADHEGAWACQMPLAFDGSDFRRGAFQLLTEGFPTDLRFCPTINDDPLEEILKQVVIRPAQHLPAPCPARVPRCSDPEA